MANQSLVSIAKQGASIWPAQTAVISAAGSLTFDALDQASDRIAGGLAERGIEPGDHVALVCPNLPAFPIAYFGILKAGAAVVPLNVLLKRRELAYHLNDSDAKAVISFSGTDELPMGVEVTAAVGETPECGLLVGIGDPGVFPDATLMFDDLQAAGHEAPDMESGDDDTAVILYTSGTTGQPKGAELSHSNLLRNAQVTAEMQRYSSDDVIYVPLPLFHSFGQSVLMNSGLLSGASLILEPRFDAAAALESMRTHRASVFAGVPTMYWALLQTPREEGNGDDLLRANLRLCVSGGASLPLTVLREFEERFEVPILEGYGLSETSPVASFNHLDRERKPGSIGTPIAGVEMRIVDENDDEVPAGETGEVVIRGHNVMKGYYKRPEANAEVLRNGWLHTGDVGRMDEDGYFYIVDRTKDMIIRGGFNVYPREVEEVLLEHPGVSMAAVIGVPDEEHGEEIVALVVPVNGEPPESDELIDWCRERLAAYKYPRRVEVRESLPLSATGKILKRELRAEFS